MSISLTVRPKLLRWARQRVSLSPNEFAIRMKVPLETLVEWEQSGAITLARLKQLAKKTHTPLGYLFLHEPPDDSLPIAVSILGVLVYLMCQQVQPAKKAELFTRISEIACTDIHSDTSRSFL